MRRLAVVLLLLAIPACKDSVRHGIPAAQRQKMLATIARVRATDASFDKLRPGTPADAVLKELGKPQAATPCPDATTCWYYDIEGDKRFVCFNSSNLVTCNGSLTRRTTITASRR